MPESSDHKLAELFALYADDQLSEEQLTELNEILRTQPEAREAFVVYCQQGQMLQELFAGTKP